jgi:hypothetical protein
MRRGERRRVAKLRALVGVGEIEGKASASRWCRGTLRK